jgi:hypothetical protein
MSAALNEALPSLRALSARLQEDAADSADPAAASTAGGPDASALRDALTELAQLLENFDMRATELVGGLRTQAGPDLEEPLQALATAVGALDFERATPLCREILAATLS